MAQTLLEDFVSLMDVNVLMAAFFEKLVTVVAKIKRFLLTLHDVSYVETFLFATVYNV